MDEEFMDIIHFLDDRDLSILYHALMLDEQYQRVYLKKSNNLNGSLYNAYTARVIVSDPILYVKNEIILRFTQINLSSS